MKVRWRRGLQPSKGLPVLKQPPHLGYAESLPIALESSASVTEAEMPHNFDADQSHYLFLFFFWPVDLALPLPRLRTLNS